MKTIISKTLISAIALLLCAALSGCATVCDEACDQLRDCGTLQQEGRCSCDSDLEECAAECVLDASCEEIDDSDPNSPYGQCMRGCLTGG